MDIYSTRKAITRARKRLAHATVQMAEAESERARMRHARRVANARRAMGDATYLFEMMALQEA